MPVKRRTTHFMKGKHMKEVLVSGKHYRVLADSVNNIWHRISYWTKASDVEFDDGTRLEGKVFGHCILTRNKDYTVGDIAYCTNAPSWVRLRCTVAGKSATTEPADYKVIQESGTSIVDGTATFVVEDIRPANELSANKNQAPSVALLKDTYEKAVDAAEKANKINLYVGEDGKLHYTDKAGADSALNFKLHDATYTLKPEEVGSVVNLGTRHNIRYVNAQNAYKKGLSDGLSDNVGENVKIEYKYHHHTLNDTNADNGNQADCPYADNYQAENSGGCFTKLIYTQHTHSTADGCKCGPGQIVKVDGGSWGDGSWSAKYGCNKCGAITGGAGTVWEGDRGAGDMRSHEESWGTHSGIHNCGWYSCSKKLNSAPKYVCTCGKTNGTLVGQTIIFGEG